MAAAIILSIAGCSQAAAPSGSSAAPADGSSAAPAENKDDILLKIWGGVPAEYGPQDMIDYFNAEFKDKGVQAEYVRFVNDETGNMKLETTLLGGGDIDIYMTYTASNLVKRGTGSMALDVSDKLTAINYDPITELGSAVEPYIIDGKVYGLPTKMENYYILANVDMFEEAGIPLPTSWTYDEFYETAKKLTKGEGQDKVYGMYWNTNMEIFRPSYIAQTVLGENFLYKEGGTESNLDNPELIRINQLVADMMLKDRTAVTHTDNVTQKLSVESMFLGGKAAMSLGVWSIRSIKDLEKYPHDFETAYLPVPEPEAGASKYAIGEGVIGDFMCINPKSANVDAAFDFLVWYVNGGMLPMAPYGRIPLTTRVSTEDKLEAYMKNGEGILHGETVSKFLENKPNMAVSTQTNKLAEIQQVYNEALESIFTGQQDAATALTAAKAKADGFLK